MQKQIGYEQAIQTKYPEPVVIAIAKDKNGKANPITLGWSMVTSGNPPMIAISVAPERYSSETIRFSRCFTIAFPSAEMADTALFFGSKSGRDIDKFAESNCRMTPASKIDSVLLADAVANFEYSLESETITGDHIIFVGKVVASHMNTKPKRRLYSIAPGHILGAAS